MKSVLSFAILLCCAVSFGADDDPILKAMHDELSRSMSLQLPSLDKPYYIDYTIDDVRQVQAFATLGALIASNDARYRQPRVTVRVGNYDFDNTNYIGSRFNFGGRVDVHLPLEDNYSEFRSNLWLATDQSYKSALEAVARKRAALRNLSVHEQLSDFAKAQPVHILDPVKHADPPVEAWNARLRRLSAIFTNYPKVRNSSIEYEALDGMHYFLTSEGTEVRERAMLGLLRVRATAQASDGMTLRDATVFQALDWSRLPAEAEIERAVKAIGENLTALSAAPMGETYSGPVLFEGEAAAQIFAEVLGKNFALTRKPVLEPGNPGSVPASDLEGRQGVRILPEFFQVVDDPTQTEYHGRPLFGSYRVDDEGVQPQPLTLVEKGVLKNFVLTRRPVRGFPETNGRARLPGAFGGHAAAVSNLFIEATTTSAPADLKQQLIDICKKRDKPYGILVRKMDFPSSAGLDEARRILSGANQSAHPVSLPLLIYRIYPDGREELVRGLRFRGFNVRSFKDILAAGNDHNIFDFLENGITYSLMGAGSEAAETAVVAPSVLIDDLELLKMEDELPKLPIVPPPDLTR